VTDGKEKPDIFQLRMVGLFYFQGINEGKGTGRQKQNTLLRLPGPHDLN